MAFDNVVVSNFVRSSMGGHMGERIVSFILEHSPDGRGVDEWPVEPDHKPEDVVRQVKDVVVGDAKTMGGVQRYYLRARFGDAIDPSKSVPITLHNPRINANSDMAGLDTVEDPTMEGFAMQQMRHIEAMARVYAPEILNVMHEKDETIADLRGQVTELREENQGLRAEMARWSKDREDNESKKYLRMVDWRGRLHKEKMWEDAFEFFGPSAMLGLHHLIGGKEKGIPTSTTTVEQMMRSVYATFGEEQMKALRMVGTGLSFSGPQRAVLAKIVEHFQSNQPKTAIEKQTSDLLASMDDQQKMAAVMGSPVVLSIPQRKILVAIFSHFHRQHETGRQKMDDKGAPDNDPNQVPGPSGPSGPNGSGPKGPNPHVTGSSGGADVKVKQS